MSHTLGEVTRHLEGLGWLLVEQDEYGFIFEYNGTPFYMPRPRPDGTYSAGQVSDLFAHRQIPHMREA